MDYSKHYNLLIERARGRLLEGYVERHHVVPRCMGGDDSADNIVELTAEEHYVAHQLLVKMYPDNWLLVYAAQMMTVGRSNNRQYGWLRRRAAQAISEANKGNVPHNKGITGEESHMYGVKRTAETKEKMRQARLGGTSGMKGRVAWNRGKKTSEETRTKISEAVSKAKRGHTHSEETKKKISESMKAARERG